MDEVEVLKSAIIVLAINTLIKDIEISLEEYDLKLTEEERNDLKDIKEVAQEILKDIQLPLDTPISRPKWSNQT